MKQQNTFTDSLYIGDFISNNFNINWDYKFNFSDNTGDMFYDNYIAVDYIPLNDMKAEAIELLKLPKSFLILHEEQFEDELIQAYNDAYNILLQDRFYSAVDEHIQDDKHFSHYENLKGQKCELWEAEKAVYTISRKEIVFAYVGLESASHDGINWAVEYGDWLPNTTDKIYTGLDNISVYDEWQAIFLEHTELPYIASKLFKGAA